MAKIVVAVLCLAAWPQGVAPGATWYVDGSVPESGDGTSWETAFKTVHEAMAVVEPEETVIVAPGVYYVWEESSRTAASDHTGTACQGPAPCGLLFAGTGFTLRGTDPLDPQTVAKTVLDGGGSLCVMGFYGPSEGMVLSGFTIRNGRRIGSGGGITGNWNDHSHATIENNIICYNTAGEGGGAIAYCDGIIRNNIIMSNLAMGHYNNFGGGLYDCDGIIEGNVILGNAATNIETGQGGRGGGLSGCDGIIRNNVIRANSAALEGGGLQNCHGTIVNNTIVGNEAEDGGGLSYCQGTITSCALWGNQTDPYGEPDFSWSSQPTYCCIQDWEGAGEGNISEDPRFVDEEKGDFRLRADSPCIDAGFNSPDLPETDIAGMHRIMFGGKSLTVDMGTYEFYINKLEPVPGTNEAVFTWSSLEGKTYSIFYTDDLFNWHTAIANFPSLRNTIISWTDDGSLTGIPPLLAPRRFYRLLENP